MLERLSNPPPGNRRILARPLSARASGRPGPTGSLQTSYEEQLERSPAAITSKGGPSSAGVEGFPALPPPALEELIGLPQTYTAARSSYLALITSEAEQRGLPSALADAVAQVESRYNPKVVGSRGEVGVMQIRPQTAALLGYKGEVTALFEPETNVRLGVAYLARAWQLAKGDVCRTLMKYRAGWGEERMTPLSVGRILPASPGPSRRDWVAAGG